MAAAAREGASPAAKPSASGAIPCFVSPTRRKAVSYQDSAISAQGDGKDGEGEHDPSKAEPETRRLESLGYVRRRRETRPEQSSGPNCRVGERGGGHSGDTLDQQRSVSLYSACGQTPAWYSFRTVLVTDECGSAHGGSSSRAPAPPSGGLAVLQNAGLVVDDVAAADRKPSTAPPPPAAVARARAGQTGGISEKRLGPRMDGQRLRLHGHQTGLSKRKASRLSQPEDRRTANGDG